MNEHPAQKPVDARGLHRFYRRGETEVAALRDVSFSVQAGEMVAIVGPSGSGKSTLLTLLAGLDDPDGGSVWIGGQRMSHRSPREQARIRAAHIGVLTQSSGLIEHLDLAGNVALAASFRPRPGGRAGRGGSSVADLLARLGMSPRSGARPSTLSGGETARANLAVALAGAPRVLLADEPTAEVSRHEEDDILELLSSARPPDGATVVVTHSSRVAEAADRVLEIVDGKLV